MNTHRDESGRRPSCCVETPILGRWPRLVLNGPMALMGRAVGACDFFTPFLGRGTRWDGGGPLAQCDADMRNGDSESTTGADSSQPGATPQVTEREPTKG